MSGVTSTDDTIEAVPVQAEACAGFHESDHDPLVCACGWLEHDHGELAARRMRPRRRRPMVVPRPERRAS